MAFYLEALGGLRLVAADGRVLQVQRRRLALLALLAAAGERGLTRDQLLGFLWPESSEDQARHALNQLLYGIRHSLGDGVLCGVDPLRLVVADLDADVLRFERASDAADHAAAVALYRGPFLHGFHLAAAPGFEPQMEHERARLAAGYVNALTHLAAAAEGRGDAAGAVPWRQALAAHDPLDARLATALMRTLADAGDSAAALAHGRVHDALVRAELGVPADRTVRALMNAIRTRAARPSDAIAVNALAMPRQPASPPAGVPHTVPAAAAASGDPPSPTGKRTRRLLTLGGVTALAAALVVDQSRGEHRAATTPAPPPSVAVLPLRTPGTDPRDAALAEGMTEELTAVLSREGDLRVIARQSATRFRGSLADVRRIADSLGVTHVIEGAYQQIDGRMRLQVRLIDGRDGSTQWSEVYDREIADVFKVQDEVSHLVARELRMRLGGPRHIDTVRGGSPGTRRRS